MAESGVEVAKKFVVTASNTELSLLVEKLKDKDIYTNATTALATILLIR